MYTLLEQNTSSLCVKYYHFMHHFHNRKEAFSSNFKKVIMLIKTPEAQQQVH